MTAAEKLPCHWLGEIECDLSDAIPYEDFRRELGLVENEEPKAGKE